MAASFPFTSPSSGTTDSSPASTTPTFTNGGGGGMGTAGWIANRLDDYGTFAAKFGTSSLLANMATNSSSSIANGVACDKCRQLPDSLSELHTLPCLHTLCRKCFQAQGSSYVPTSHQHLACPICGGGDGQAATSTSLFHNFSSLSSSLANNRLERSFPASALSGDMSINAPLLSSASYLFNEQLNVDTSLLLGSLLDSVSVHDDTTQIQPKENQLGSLRERDLLASKFSSLALTSGSSNIQTRFQVPSCLNATTATNILSPSAFHQSQSRFQYNLPTSTLPSGVHRAPGMPAFSTQQQHLATTQTPKIAPSFSSSASSFATAPTCSMCSDGAEAACRCEDCAEYLCVRCVQAHLRVRLTKDHRIVPVAVSAGQRLPNQTAPLHSPGPWHTSGLSTGSVARTPPGQQFVLSRQQQADIQQQPSPAFLSQQKPHDTSSNESHSLTQLFNDSRQCVRMLDEAVRGIDHMTERVETRMHSVANEIRAVIHQHISALEERKRELLERVDAVRSAKLRSLNLQKEDLRRYLASSKTTLEQAEKLLACQQQKPQRAEDSDETIGRIRHTLQEHLHLLSSARPCLQPQEDDQLNFSSPDASILKTVRLLGNVITGAYAPNCTLLGDPIRRAIKDKPICYTVQARDHIGEPLTTGGDPVNAFVVSKSAGASADSTPLPVNVYDKKNGTYFCRFEPTQEGEHQVHIFVRGSQIRGSPFTLIVRRGRDYTTIGAAPILSFGGEGTGDGQLCRPWGICCDKQGRLLVADRSNSRIQVFDQEGKFLYKFGSPGCRNGQFDRPAGITVNSRNQVIIVDKDNHRVQVFTVDGQFLFKFGEKGRGNGQFNYPWDVAVSSNDDSIAVSDTRNHRVQLFDSQGSFLNKFGFESSLFYKQFDSPRGLVFAPDGRLFCTDFNNHRLAVIDIVHNQMEFFGREGECDGAFKRPQGVDMDSEGHLIIVDSRNNRLQVFTPQLTFLCSFGLDGYPPRGRSVMDRPCDVCVCEGKIFVVDFGNNKIHVF